MNIDKNFSGGNIQILKEEKNTVFLDRELRDTQDDWFYWAFCVEDAGGKEITFDFNGQNRIGYYGPAVSYDLVNWHWLNKEYSGTKFTYDFKKNENKVYFAHDMIYSPVMFTDFAASKNLEVQTFCKSGKGRDIPYISFGQGDKIILLTARHHACESTGNYVLQGVVESLLKTNLNGFKVICVPFMDYDGVVDGDQGKNRIPYDHNRDYGNEPSIYESTGKIREIADSSNVVMGFDFHSPWHLGGRNDKVFLVQKNIEHLDRQKKFGEILENSISEKSIKYSAKNDILPDCEWNSSKSECFANYLWQHNVNLAFSLETMFFGESDNVFSHEKAIELGHCFATAINEYIKIMKL